MQTFTFFGAKTPDFSKFMVCRTDRVGRASADIFRTRGSIFRNFGQTSFMDGSLLQVRLRVGFEVLIHTFCTKPFVVASVTVEIEWFCKCKSLILPKTTLNIYFSLMQNKHFIKDSEIFGKSSYRKL